MAHNCCAHGACVQGNDSTWPAIITIELTGNQLTGELPSQWARDDYYDNLRVLLLGNNQLSGQVRVLGAYLRCTAAENGQLAPDWTLDLILSPGCRQLSQTCRRPAL